MYEADWMSRVMSCQLFLATITVIHITVKNTSGLLADLSISCVMFENEHRFKPTSLDVPNLANSQHICRHRCICEKLINISLTLKSEIKLGT